MFLKFNLPWTTIILYVIAAVLPAAVLMFYVYRKDRVEKEPGSLLRKLLLGGVLAALASIALEFVSERLLVSYAENAQMSMSGYSLASAVSVGIIEELTKFFFLYKFSWNHKAFNYTFDGVVYAVFVSLGFALWENIDYVVMYGFGTAMIRAVTAIPGHACFGVFMGAWYGLAKAHQRHGHEQSSRICRRLALICPVLLHGLYDFIATMDQTERALYFVGFIALMFFAAYQTIRRLARQDRYL